ncbi:transcription antiterminator [Megamonas funiformis]|uniref:BglG family transcription antiterminator n=1 Tax=Megamonas funiformis TaxID=437897 RepID=UPI000E4B8B5A|nr:BglG family transcription antiterminator [Megamonas funiformis]RHG04379.1 transcription antiterminator [Megamonas funiformis]
MAKINKRRKRIFDMLKSHPQGLNGEAISQQLGVSSRTIRSDIKALQDALGKYNIRIFSSPTKGYRFSNFEHLGSIEQELFKDSISKLETSKQRINYILYRLLENTLNDVSITQNDLAEEMYISLSTLKMHLNEVKDILKKYDLKIAQYKTKGIKISGEENKLRYCIVDIKNIHLENEFFQNLISNINTNLLDDIIKKVLSERKLQLTDRSQKKLCMYIAIAIQRSKNNKTVVYPSSLTNKIENTFEYNVAKEIVENIYTQLNTDLSCSEVYYITQCLLASKKLIDVSESTNKKHVKNLVNIILKEIYEKLSIDFTNDEYLIDGLTLHLNIALTRIQFQMNIRNELLETIKNDYPLAFQMGVIAGKIVEQYDNIKINENEIGYIALHFGAALSRNGIKENIKAKNIIIVCSSGLGISVLLKAKVEEYFHNRLNVIKVMPSYEINNQILDNVDYILSTVPLKNVKSDKIIKINRMLQKEDVENIENKIFHKETTELLEITTFFNKDNFYIGKNFETKEECINFLADEAIKKGLMNNNAKMSIFEREEMSSTSIGDLVAIPHPIYNECGTSFISILILNKPIIWDDLFVQVVFLLNVEKGKMNLWEPMFLKLYNYIKLKNGVNSILKNKSYEVFINEFEKMF